MASIALVNDLDLKLIAPDGTVYLGNHFANNYSVPNGNPAKDRDNRNNIEQVWVQDHFRSGIYQLVVSGYNVPCGQNADGSNSCVVTPNSDARQPFALVISIRERDQRFLPLMNKSESENNGNGQPISTSTPPAYPPAYP